MNEEGPFHPWPLRPVTADVLYEPCTLAKPLGLVLLLRVMPVGRGYICESGVDRCSTNN